VVVFTLLVVDGAVTPWSVVVPGLIQAQAVAVVLALLAGVRAVQFIYLVLAATVVVEQPHQLVCSVFLAVVAVLLVVQQVATQLTAVLVVLGLTQVAAAVVDTQPA
jgi:hypothetical protein